MFRLDDHPRRYELSNELHARPPLALPSLGSAVFFAVKREKNAVNRDRNADRDHLIDLLDRFAAPHPRPDANHYFGQIGRHKLRWEQHNEFVTYTAFLDGVFDKSFDAGAFDVFPEDWVARAPGVRITSAHIRIQPMQKTDAEMHELIGSWFVQESVASNWVLNKDALIAGDFRIDEAGHVRFAAFIAPNVHQGRIGRIVQRLCEIETYKSMSMLGFPVARDILAEMGRVDPEVTALVETMTSDSAPADATLGELLKISQRLEQRIAATSFRLSATFAYEAIVQQRVAALHEERFLGGQTLSEFMMRRYDPAMRTVKSAQSLLAAIAQRAARAGELLRTRMDVERAEQNQKLLSSMNERAHVQLRLQETVEGLSVVAVGYYAVSLAGYLFYPLTKILDVSKGMLTAGLTLPVLGLIWFGIRRIRKALSHKSG